MSQLLAGRDLSLFRGDRCLFRRVDFALAAGELLTIEGPNGSGKTSLLRGIAGLTGFETGEILWRGESARRNAQRFRGELAWFGHRVGFKLDLDLAQNLRFESSLRSTFSARYETAVERLGLAGLAGLPLRALSAGQQRRVALARLLLSDARLWMLDEPLTNLDRDGQRLVADLIAGHLDAGGVCVAASHQPLELDAAGHRIALR